MSDGHVSSYTVELNDEITNFYQALYQSQGYNPMEELLQCVHPGGTADMNHILEREYMAAEVKTALFDMAPSKAPGVDRFTAGFYQRHWDVVGEDITLAILSFLNGGELPLGLNDTAITFTVDDEPRARSVRAPAALVLNPTVNGFRLTKVLMD